MSRDIQSSLGPAVTGTVPAVVVSWFEKYLAFGKLAGSGWFLEPHLPRKLVDDLGVPVLEATMWIFSRHPTTPEEVNLMSKI